MAEYTINKLKNLDQSDIFKLTDYRLDGGSSGQVPTYTTDGSSFSWNYKADGDTDGNAYRAVSIPFGVCTSFTPYSTSCATQTTIAKQLFVECTEITELRPGVAFVFKNGLATGATGLEVQVNNFTALPVYNNYNARMTNALNLNYTFLLSYNSDRISGGCWDIYGYDSNTNTIGYQLRTNSQTMPLSDICARYRILFTSAAGTSYIAANHATTTNSTAARAVTTQHINPFGPILYYSGSTQYTTGTKLAASVMWQQYNITLGYSFNRTGKALTLTTSKPIYIKCTPQTDGSAVIDPDTPYTQDLPSSDDGKVYIFLGIATSATAVEVMAHHPIYYYKDGAVREWANDIDLKPQIATTATVNSDGSVSFKNSSGTSLFSFQLPLYDGSVT